MFGRVVLLPSSKQGSDGTPDRSVDLFLCWIDSKIGRIMHSRFANSTNYEVARGTFEAARGFKLCGRLRQSSLPLREDGRQVERLYIIPVYVHTTRCQSVHTVCSRPRARAELRSRSSNTTEPPIDTALSLVDLSRESTAPSQ
jgi:hypothetical protein